MNTCTGFSWKQDEMIEPFWVNLWGTCKHDLTTNTAMQKQIDRCWLHTHTKTSSKTHTHMNLTCPYWVEYFDQHRRDKKGLYITGKACMSNCLEPCRKKSRNCIIRTSPPPHCVCVPTWFVWKGRGVEVHSGLKWDPGRLISLCLLIWQQWQILPHIRLPRPGRHTGSWRTCTWAVAEDSYITAAKYTDCTTRLAHVQSSGHALEASIHIVHATYKIVTDHRHRCPCKY